MNKYVITFGSGQLKTISHVLNPMNVMLIVKDETEKAAREQVVNSFIGNRFCTSYKESFIKEFEEKYGMIQYTLDELKEINKKERKLWMKQKND